MANVKITDLPASTDPVSTDVLPIVDVSADATKKVSIETLLKNASNGTESAPSFSFDGDGNTGIYHPAADQVAISTNGVQRILIEDSGVTIPGNFTVNGTTTTIDTTTLVVEDKNIEIGKFGTPTDTTADGGGITLKGSSDKTIKWVESTGCWTFNQPIETTGNVTVGSGPASGAGSKLWSTGFIELRNDTASVNVIRLFSGGYGDVYETFGVSRAGSVTAASNVLIGKTTTTLTTAGSQISSGSSSFTGDSNSTNLAVNAGGAIQLANKDSTDNNFSNIGGYNSNGLVVSQIDFINKSHSSRTGEIAFLTHSGSAMPERMRIDSSGKVGIGTAAPKRLLHLNGANETVKLQITNTTTGSANDGQGCQLGIATDGTAFLEQRENLDLFFSTNNTERMRINSSGNVFIGGTTASNADIALNANGSITAAGTFASSNTISTRISDSIDVGFYVSNSDVAFNKIQGRVFEVDNGGTVCIGGSAGNSLASYTSPNIKLNSNGNVEIAGTFKAHSHIESDRTNGSFGCFFGKLNGTTTSFILADGTAEFDGSVTVGNAGQALVSDNGIYLKDTGSASSSNFNVKVDTNGSITAAGTLTLNKNYGGNPSGNVKTLVINSGGTNTSGAMLEKIAMFADGKITTPGAVLINTSSQIAGEKLTVNNSGSTANTAAFHFAGTQDRANVICQHNRATGGTNSQQIAFLNAAGTAVGNISSTGSSTSYNESSDYRLKENITKITDGITRVKQLKPSRFNFINIDATVDGFIAHEAQTVVPEAVVGAKDQVDEDGNPVMQGIDKSKLVPLLTAALQEAIAKIETLETKVAALEAG